MNTFCEFLLKSSKHLYTKVCPPQRAAPQCILDLAVANQQISSRLTDKSPFMAARLGATELACMANFFGIHTQKRDIFGYIKGQAQPWWWNRSILAQMEKWSGFFPPTPENAERFCNLMITCLDDVDILGSWLHQELLFEKNLMRAVKVELQLLNPFFVDSPWTHKLEGKRVLVIHPFSDTIRDQYAKRNKIFPNGLLPDFTLITLKAEQTIGGASAHHQSWFAALESMKERMLQTEFDVCLVGCGAYGFPLASHAKRMGKKAIHLGGALQILFGIKGRRWEDPKQTHLYAAYQKIFNEHWVRPSQSETPVTANNVENACYW